MTEKELIGALRRNMVETGSLVCLSCKYENKCGVHGCAIMRDAANALEQMQAQLAASVDCIGALELCIDTLSTATEYIKPYTGVWHTVGIAKDIVSKWRGAREAGEVEHD